MHDLEELLTIQELGYRLRVPKHTLRFWEKELGDIVVPLRTNGGQRRYTADNISTLEEIRNLRKTGMSLAEIKRKLSNSNRGKECHSNRNIVDFLADRVAEVVKAEIHRFLESQDRHA